MKFILNNNEKQTKSPKARMPVITRSQTNRREREAAEKKAQTPVPQTSTESPNFPKPVTYEMPSDNDILVFNARTDEFFVCENDEQIGPCLYELMNNAERKSRWQISDKIKTLPAENFWYLIRYDVNLLCMDEFMEKKGLCTRK